MTAQWVMPASFAQERFFLLTQLPASRVDHHTITARLWLDGPLDVDALHAAVGDLIGRHEVLRTGLRSDRHGNVHQHVWASRPVQFEVTDLTAASKPELDAVTHATEVESSAVPLADGLVCRLWLGRTGHERHLLSLVVHHAAADAVSMNLLLAELGIQYRHHLSLGEALPPVTLQYADFAVWERESAKAGDFDDDLAYWSALFDRLDPAALPRGGSGTVTPVSLDQDTSRRLRQAARTQSTPVFSVLVAAVAGRLQQVTTGGTHLPVMVPVAGRDRPELETMVGCLINNVVLVLPTDSTGSELAAAVHTRWVSALEHAGAPFELVLRRCAPRQRQALTQVLLNVRPSTPTLVSWTPELTLHVEAEPPPPPSFPLALQLELSDTGPGQGHLVCGPGGVADNVAADLAHTLDSFGSPNR